MRRILTCLLLSCSLGIDRLGAQVEPDTFLRDENLGIRVWEVLPDRLLRPRILLQPLGPNDLRVFFAITVDPRTGEIWSPQQDGAYPASVARIEILGSHYRVAEEILLPFSLSQVAGAAFNDDGHFVVCGTGGVVHTIDLERRQILSSVCTCLGFVSTFVPARAGRPAVLEYWDYPNSLRFIVSIDSGGNVLHTYYRSSVGTNSRLTQGMATTQSGRCFLAGSPGSPLSGLREIDFAARMIRVREDLFPNGSAGLIEDASRGILHLWYPLIALGAPTRGVYDLATNRTVQQFVDPERSSINISNQSHAGWYPRDRILISPLRPQPGSSFDAALAVGGDPGAVALLWFDRAELSGIPVLGISTVVSTGVVDGSGLFRTRLRYRPSILPLHSGDALFFEGFSWDGSSLARTGAGVMRWR